MNHDHFRTYILLNSMNVKVFALSLYQSHKCQRVIAMKYKSKFCLVLNKQYVSKAYTYGLLDA